MSTFILEAEKYVYHLLSEKLDSNYIYHNLSHTQRVVEKTTLLAQELKINPTASEDLLLASWFHDTGYINGAKNHEEESAKIATNFLKKQAFPKNRIENVCSLILATKMDYVPKNDLEKIISDADCAHLGSKNFSDYTALLRKEWELTEDNVFSEIQWAALNIDFFTQHRFYTNYSLKNWSRVKEKNLANLLKNQKKISADEKKYSQKKEELDFKKDKKEFPERGIETMFRVALRNHITLSDIADTKANILLSVNAIIISVALSNLLPKLDNPSNTYLIYPTLIFLISTVVSITLSVLATRPNITKGKFTKEDVANKKVNLLFFGNFHQMKLPDFEWAMNQMMQDKSYLYASLTKDLYFLGLVLNRKYSLLRTTYTVFIFGIIVSVLAFSIAFSIQATA